MLTLGPRRPPILFFSPLAPLFFSPSHSQEHSVNLNEKCFELSVGLEMIEV